jgi:hypothetical protein
LHLVPTIVGADLKLKIQFGVRNHFDLVFCIDEIPGFYFSAIESISIMSFTVVDLGERNEG